MSEDVRDIGDRHVTRRDLGLELRSMRYEMRLLIALSIVATNFDVPDKVTAVAVGALLLKAATGLVVRS